MSRTNKTDMRDFDEQTGGNDHHAHFKNAPDHDGDGDVQNKQIPRKAVGEMMPVLLATNMAVPDWMMIKIDNLSGFSRWSPCANNVYNMWTQKTILSFKKNH